MARFRLALLAMLYASVAILGAVPAFAEDLAPKCIDNYGVTMKASVASLLRLSYGERARFFDLDYPGLDDTVQMGVAGEPLPSITLITRTGPKIIDSKAPYAWFFFRQKRSAPSGSGLPSSVQVAFAPCTGEAIGYVPLYPNQ